MDNLQPRLDKAVVCEAFKLFGLKKWVWPKKCKAKSYIIRATKHGFNVVGIADKFNLETLIPRRETIPSASADMPEVGCTAEQ